MNLPSKPWRCDEEFSVRDGAGRLLFLSPIDRTPEVQRCVGSLIAAAPEMLEALNILPPDELFAIVSYLGCSEEPGAKKAAEAVARFNAAAEAAIAKAEGKQ